MSTSSRAFKELLGNSSYFQKKVTDILECRGNRAKTGEVISEFVCNLGDKRTDIEQALGNIDKLNIRIKNMTESDMKTFDLPEDSLKKGAKEYLLHLLNLFKINHKICLHCIKKEWDKAAKKCDSMIAGRGGEISSYFSTQDPQIMLALNGSRAARRLMENEDEALESGDLQVLKKSRSLYPKEFKEIFPMLEDIIDLSEPSSKRRRPNPTEDY